MQTVKIRRVGNSNVISLPRGITERGFAEGQEVWLVPLQTGRILLIAEDHLDDFVAEMGRRVIDENREALEKLPAYDRAPASEAAVR